MNLPALLCATYVVTTTCPEWLRVALRAFDNLSDAGLQSDRDHNQSAAATLSDSSIFKATSSGVNRTTDCAIVGYVIGV